MLYSGLDAHIVNERRRRELSQEFRRVRLSPEHLKIRFIDVGKGGSGRDRGSEVCCHMCFPQKSRRLRANESSPAFMRRTHTADRAEVLGAPAKPPTNPAALYARYGTRGRCKLSTQT